MGPCLGFRATSSNSGFATPFVYASYGEVVARVEALAAGMEKGGEELLDRNEDGMLLVSYIIFGLLCFALLVIFALLMYARY